MYVRVSQFWNDKHGIYDFIWTSTLIFYGLNKINKSAYHAQTTFMVNDSAFALIRKNGGICNLTVNSLSEVFVT